MFIKNVTNNKVSDVLSSCSLLPDPNIVLTSYSSDWYEWCLQNEDVVVENNTVETNIIEIEPGNDETDDHETKGLPITVITGHRPSIPAPEPRPPPTIKTVRRSNKALKALSLPNLWGAGEHPR